MPGVVRTGIWEEDGFDGVRAGGCGGLLGSAILMGGRPGLAWFG